MAPIVLDKNLCADSEEPASGKCFKPRMFLDDDGEYRPEVHEGDLNAAALRTIEALLVATGDAAIGAEYFGNTQQLNPGGWGGGNALVASKYDGVVFHEIGHALGLPHWGQGHYDPGDQSLTTSYPYGGIKNDGGGRGDTWNYYQNAEIFVSPLCEDRDRKDVFGKERSDAMFRTSYCLEYRNGKPGPWDGFSDFSDFAIYRYMSGAPEVYKGTVPYARKGTAPFS
ncbi:MAG TPA: M66 family metalloprotease, partial [Labilithrix sp.]|nr:M66 family metalloprotease [Labilithrix sp.]